MVLFTAKRDETGQSDSTGDLKVGVRNLLRPDSHLIQR